MKKLTFLLIVLLITSCAKREQADLIIINANVYTVDESFSKVDAFAVKNGKFLETGTSEAILKKYESTQIYDVHGQSIVPGLIDAHCHFYNLGLQKSLVDLVGTTSFVEVVKQVVDFQKKRKTNFIIGRGWDQNDWEEKIFPNKKLLDQLFPNIPVVLTRIDGHAMLCNQAALNLAGITKNTKVEGGEIVKENEKLTGILIDNPMELVSAIIPKPSRKQQIAALLEAQKICFNLGLTTVDDAGLDRDLIELIDSLQQTGDLKMRVYAMISNTKENLDYYLPNKTIKTEKLHVNSVKVYADGALGSRGAALKQAYSDKENHFGAMLTSHSAYKKLANRIAKSNFQMNTHAIGDSANSYVLKTYKSVLKNKNDRRWRVEHAQVITDNDLEYFSDANILPSVQPTHATSDMYWAKDRLGDKRIQDAYAYKNLLKKHGKIALGTDFPIENPSPFYTFYAAVARQDLKQFPKEGFLKENALTREETLKGMTIWAAYANFEDNEKGSIETGKFADFIILEKDIMKIPVHEIPNLKVKATFVDGVAQ